MALFDKMMARVDVDWNYALTLALTAELKRAQVDEITMMASAPLRLLRRRSL